MSRIHVAAATVVLLTACALPRQPDEGNKRVEQIDQAASLHTSITSIAPWDDIKDKLKPGFVLSAPDALAKSIPTTLVRLDRALDILRFQLALTPSITRRSSTSTESSGTGKDSMSTTESTVEKASPELPAMAPPTGVAASAPARPEVTPPDNAADALLQYQTAANLLRDIAVLNAEIDNVARRTGQDAFLARIQVSVMPLQRGLGYDVYANISMFATTGGHDPVTGRRTMGDVLPAVPLVIPILSTDSLQATRRTGSSTIEREVGLALNLLKSFGALGASFGRDQQSERAMAGAELESVVTVGRLSDNTIRVRMGADTLPGGGYGMVPRTFNISAVVFLPKSATQLYYVSRLSLHHVLDGSELSTQRTPSYDEEIETVRKGHVRTFPKLTVEQLKNPLDDHAYHGNFEAFSQTLDEIKNSNVTPLEVQREKMYLWSQLVALNRRSRYAHSLIDVPRTPPPTWPDPNQLVVYTSDAKGLSFNLAFGGNLRADAIDARLQLAECQESTVRPMTGGILGMSLQTGNSCSSVQPVELYVQPTSLTASGNARSLAIQFPPLEAVQHPGSRARVFVPHAIVLGPTPGTYGVRTTSRYVVFGRMQAKTPDKKPAEPAPALLLESAVVRADAAGRGRLAFVVQGGGKQDLKVRIHSSVAGLSDDNGKQVERRGQNWEIADGGRYLISLENLSISGLVRLELWTVPADKDKAATLNTAEARVEEPRGR